MLCDRCLDRLGTSGAEYEAQHTTLGIRNDFRDGVTFGQRG